MKKGFTLIELLIVITIIGILAVAFLPTLLGAPSKARDTQRIADLQKIQKVLINHDLENASGYPYTASYFQPALPTGWLGADNTFSNAFLDDFGGVFPVNPDPKLHNWDYIYTGGQYYRDNNLPGAPYIPVQYDFALRVGVENFENANAHCQNDVRNGLMGNQDEGDSSTWCYGIIVM